MKTKKILFVTTLVLLILPLTIMYFPFIKSAGLKGAVVETKDAEFSWKQWFSGDYQKRKDEYLNTHLGFYPDFIRINNQIDFSFFGLLHAKEVHEGENHFLYEEGYIHSYLGMDLRDEDSILMDCLAIKWIQDSLSSKGKIFLFVIATNKADYYPNNLPQVFRRKGKPKRNYPQYLQYFDSLGISYIDFNGDFVQRKKTTPYPLITKFGTHWSSYGAALAADSIIRFLNYGFFDKKLAVPKFIYKSSLEYNKHDKEVFDPLNLIFGWTDIEETAWSTHSIKSNANTVKPIILFVADSYYWEIYEQKIMENVFSEPEFWYYNREHWSINHKRLGDETLNPSLGNQFLKKSEIVVMMASEYHLNCLSADFIKKIQRVYHER